ncbi:MAG: hypothetical protein R3Y56_08430 [Akkermansia sp.]
MNTNKNSEPLKVSQLLNLEREELEQLINLEGRASLVLVVDNGTRVSTLSICDTTALDGLDAAYIKYIQEGLDSTVKVLSDEFNERCATKGEDKQ